MSNKPLPLTLNDGKFNYRQVRQETPVNPDDPTDPRTNCAVYERIPKDPKSVFTPSLSYTTGVVEVPLMEPLERGEEFPYY